MDHKHKPGKHQHAGEGGMGTRGVTRHMAEMEIQKQAKKRKEGQAKENEGNESMQGMNMMDSEEKMKMLHMHHKNTLWVYWLVIILGVWVLLAPFTFDYGRNPAVPSGGREVWLSLADRIAFMRWSDIISGALLIIFGWRSLTVNRPISVWIACFVGVWLNIAPLIFWSPSSTAYLNDTLVGALVIALTILIPGMPNMVLHMQMGPDIPKGWSYNPSSWPQRSIMIFLGFMGWLVSRYIGAFQLGYTDYAWDPFFGDSTMNVLNSNMSHSLPISDASFGALAYAIEFLMGFMGSQARWRTMPWMVTFFGILVIPLGLVHIFLVISQPIAVGAWCTMCLFAAGIMLPMIPLQVDEVIGMGQFMVQAKRKGQSLWNAFWMGGTAEGEGKDERSPEIMELPSKGRAVFNSSLWGMSAPWTLVASLFIGIYLMFSPALFGLQIQTPASNINHLLGALIVVVSVISMAEPIRLGRYMNVLLGLALAIGIWFTDNATTAVSVNALIAGIIVAGLSIPRGPKKESYGLWDKYVK